MHTLQGISNAQKTIFSCQVHSKHVCKNIHIFKYTKNIFSQVHGEQGPNSVHQNLWGGSGAGAQGGQADHEDGDRDDANYFTKNFYFGQLFFSIIPLLFQGNFAFLCESAMLDYFVQQDCNLTQIGGLLDSKVSQNLGLGLGFSLGEIVILVLRWAWLCNSILLQDSNFEILIKTNLKRDQSGSCNIEAAAINSNLTFLNDCWWSYSLERFRVVRCGRLDLVSKLFVKSQTEIQKKTDTRIHQR